MKVELKLNNVTHLFLAGANQQEPELRSASVRGMLRFWLRACLGGVVGDKNLTELQRLEADIFGEAERGSKVTVRLSQTDIQYHMHDAPLLPHKQGNMVKAIDAGVEFNLSLILKPCTAKERLEIATWSALLWLTLGGLGRRSRRGAGSVRLIEVVSAPDDFSDELQTCLNDAAKSATNREELAKSIVDLKNKAIAAFKTYASTISPKFSSGLPTFSVLLPSTRIIVWMPTGASDHNTALAELMKEMHRLKVDPNVDFENAFGGISSRRASPLLATVHQLQSGWALVLTHLRAEIQSGTNGKPIHVEDWLDKLINSGEAIECK